MDAVPGLLTQAALAALYYVVLVVIVRLAGKRLAGQITTFDLLVLISLNVVLQQVTTREGPAHGVVFIVVVFAIHRANALACARSRRFRRLVRGAPRPLVVDGRIDYAALEDEGLTVDELIAGLRRLGHDDPARVRRAVLEETGHISAVCD